MMNKPQKNTVLYFPIKAYISDLQLAYNAKLSWVRIINMAVTGTRELTDKDRASLKRLNELLAISGCFSLLEFD